MFFFKFLLPDYFLLLFNYSTHSTSLYINETLISHKSSFTSLFSNFFLFSNCLLLLFNYSTHSTSLYINETLISHKSSFTSLFSNFFLFSNCLLLLFNYSTHSTSLYISETLVSHKSSFASFLSRKEEKAAENDSLIVIFEINFALPHNFPVFLYHNILPEKYKHILPFACITMLENCLVHLDYFLLINTA